MKLERIGPDMREDFMRKFEFKLISEQEDTYRITAFLEFVHRPVF
jgi:hypothetical protein